MELTAGWLTNVVGPGLLTSLVLHLLTLVQVGHQSAQPLGVAGRGAVAGAGLAAGAAHQPRAWHPLARPQVQGRGGEGGVERVHLHVDVTPGPVTRHGRAQALVTRALLPLVTTDHTCPGVSVHGGHVQLPGPGPHLGPGHGALQGPAEVQGLETVMRTLGAVMGGQRGATQNL